MSDEKQEQVQYEYESDIPAGNVAKKFAPSKLVPGTVCVVTRDSQKYFVKPGTRPAAKEESEGDGEKKGGKKPKE